MLYLFKEGRNQEEHKAVLEDMFVSTCLLLLKNCLEENNMTNYLAALEVAHYFFALTLNSEVVLSSL